MVIPKHIIESVKNSVGYVECSNKESFMIGSGVAFKRAEEFYEAQIQNLTSEVEGYKTAYTLTQKDLETIANILSRYATD